MILNTKTRIAAMVIATAMIATPAFAETATQNFENIPNNLVYEGRILSSSGEKLEGEYVARFSFWNNSDFTASSILDSGAINPEALGFSKWEEIIPLQFNDLGHFSVILGESKDFSTLQFGAFKYLQVEIKKVSEPDSEYQLIDINGDNGADTNDRKLIASVPYAIHSYSAQNAINATGSKNENFIIDNQNRARNEENNISELSLQFGNDLNQALNKKISYNLASEKFNFDASVNIEGDISTTGLVNGINISELNTQVQNITETQNTPAFIIDPNNQHETENLTLQFGGTLAETFTWDRAEERFALSNDLFILGNIDVSGLVDGVDIAGLNTIVTQSQADIIKNASDILSNVNTITEIQTKLTANELKIVANAEKILTNINNIAGNTGNITTNTEEISLLKTNLTTAEAKIVQNAGEILANYNVITQAQSDILANTAKITTNANTIAENTTDILKNVQDILNNKSTIANLETKLTQAEQYIVDNAEKIAQNTNKITTAQADIITNAGDILANHNLITQAQSDILANTTKITTNANTIAGNTLNIVENAEKITNLENRALVSESKIEKNIIDINENVQDIAEHEEAITILKAEIAELRTLQSEGASSTTNYDAEITNLENKVNDINADIVNIKNDITNLEQEVEKNANNIILNATEINTITNKLSTAEQNILNNANDILDNATDITKAEQNIITNATAILANNNLITQSQQDILNNAAEIETLKTKVTNLENRVSTNEIKLSTAEQNILDNAQKILGIAKNANDISDAEQDIINNAAQILQNKSAITNLEQRVTATENAINTNSGNIQIINTTIGDSDFTGATYITFGATLTDALQELDSSIKTVADTTAQNANNINSLKDTIANLTTSKDIIEQVAIGTGVVRLDGTDNKINVYTSTEQGVENAHHFYKIYSQQSLLQDIDLQFKVLLPKNFDSFTGYEFSYKTDGTIDDAKLDIEVKDARGTIAYAERDIASNTWITKTETTLSPNFAPQAEEYVYITFKAHSKDANEVKIGDITIQYTTK